MHDVDASSEGRSLLRRVGIALVFTLLALLLAAFGITAAQALARRLRD
jgi:hypothetical protein